MFQIETRKNEKFNLTEILIPADLCEITKDTRFSIILPEGMTGAIPLNTQGQRTTKQSKKTYQTSRFVQIWVKTKQ